MMELNMAYLCAQFDDSSISRSRDMVAVHKILHGSRDLITPLSGMVCPSGGWYLLRSACLPNL